MPYDPNLFDKASRLMGRVSLGMQGGEAFVESELAPRPLAQLLDTFERQGLAGAVVDVRSPAGHELADSFMQVPRLDKQIFMKGGPGAGSRRVLGVQGSEDNPIWIPTGNIVSAPGLDDWSGKGRYKRGATDVPSRKIIRGLARKGSPTAQIPEVIAYAQPDGQVMYSVVGDGAHRTAGAVARGDKAMPVGRVLVNRLPRNVLPPVLR